MCGGGEGRAACAASACRRSCRVVIGQAWLHTALGSTGQACTARRQAKAGVAVSRSAAASTSLSTRLNGAALPVMQQKGGGWAAAPNTGTSLRTHKHSPTILTTPSPQSQGAVLRAQPAGHGPQPLPPITCPPLLSWPGPLGPHLGKPRRVCISDAACEHLISNHQHGCLGCLSL